MNFDQCRIFYTIDSIFDSIKKVNDVRNILIIGDEDIYWSDKCKKKYSYDFKYMELSNIKKLIKTYDNSFQLNYENCRFDVVIAIDIIENIEEKYRGNLIKELCRVTSGYIIIGGPYYDIPVVDAEIRISNLYREMNGKRYTVFDEHRNNKLPKIEEVLDVLSELGMNHKTIEHGKLDSWEKLTMFDMIMKGNPNNKNQLAKFYDFYLQNIAEYDKGNENYRKYIIAGKIENFERSLPQFEQAADRVCDSFETPKINEFRSLLLSALLTDDINRICDQREEQIQFKDLEDTLMKMIDDKDRHIYNLENRFKLSFIIKRIKKVIKEKKVRRKLKKLIKPFYNIIIKIRIRNIKKAIGIIRQSGFKALLEKARKTDSMANYDKWAHKKLVSEKTLLEQSKQVFSYKPLISIIVPTYNTPAEYLRAMIDSVIKQSYANWELCLADGNSTNAQVKNIIHEYGAKDNRIKYTFLDTNLGISGNTNEALKLASGEYIGLLDHDDMLTYDALYEVVKVLNRDTKPEVIYSDEDKTDERGKNYFEPNFKPDFSPDTMRSYNYICHFLVFSIELMNIVGTFNNEFDGAQDHDLVLRLTEKANEIYHIPKVLYHWRVHQASTAANMNAKNYAIEAGKKAIAAQLNRLDLKGTVKEGLFRGSYKVDYEIEDAPKISIIILNRDEERTLRKCIDSILDKSTYDNYEIIIVENNSKTKEIFSYYEELEQNSRISVIKWEKGFNYSALNNYAVQHATGDYLLLLNNDVEVISANWMEEMVMFAQRNDVGIVGAKLYYPDFTIQHAGVILGIGGVAGHSHKYYKGNENGFIGRLKVVQNLSAVTAACLMVRKSVYLMVNGFDENYSVAFNDIDFCMKIRGLGKLVVFNPYVELYHYESKSRGLEDTPEKIKRFKNETYLFKKKWGMWLNDPYYNVNLTKQSEDFSLNVTEEQL